MRLAVCNFAIPIKNCNVCPLRDFVRTLSLARSVRIHTMGSYSHIRYSSFPARGFCHRMRRHCTGRRCHNSVGFTLRNATGYIHGLEASVPFVRHGVRNSVAFARRNIHSRRLTVALNSQQFYILPWRRKDPETHKKLHIGEK